MRVLTVHTDFAHHGPLGGYKQILKFVAPSISLKLVDGYESSRSTLKHKYKWLQEFEILKHLSKIDLIHILYGEEYLRFAPYLFPRLPLVVTFHQPPEKLKKHLHQGNGMGRVDALTHKLTLNRFKKIDAAIITDHAQRPILERYIPVERIHEIPLGIYLEESQIHYDRFKAQNLPKKDQVIVLGNWLRDWHLLKAIAEQLTPYDVQIKVVGRNISDETKYMFNENLNVEFLHNLSDNELKEQLYVSKVSLLPLIEAAGNNALMESLAMGCNVIMSNVVSDNFLFKNEALHLISTSNVEGFTAKILSLMKLSESESNRFAEIARESVNGFSWKSIANKTIEVYKKLV